jgi:pimeloyl-ACP methyl ester carboxylesterase
VKTFKKVLVQNEELAAVIYDAGSSRGDVVLIHGFTGSKEDFTEIAERISYSGFRVLTFDNRGQNESGHSSRVDAYLIDSLARDVAELTDKFDLKSPHLLGHSFGGLVAQHVVLSFPNKWSSLTLLCSGPQGREGWFREPEFELLGKFSMRELWIQYLDEKRKSHPYYEIQKKRWGLSDPRSTLAFREQLFHQPSRIAELAALPIPSHVIFGENDDAWPVNDQLEMATALSSEVTILENSGHCPNEDNPDLTAGELVRFWLKHSSLNL